MQPVMAAVQSDHLAANWPVLKTDVSTATADDSLRRSLIYVNKDVVAIKIQTRAGAMLIFAVSTPPV